MKRFPLLLVFIAVVLAGIGVLAQSPSAITANASKEIDTLLQQAVQPGVVPDVVAMVATKDKVLYQGAFGLMDVGKQKPMQKDSIFRIASKPSRSRRLR